MPEQARSTMAVRGNIGGRSRTAHHTPREPAMSTAVALSSLTPAQRSLILALLEAAKTVPRQIILPAKKAAPTIAALGAALPEVHHDA
jgi:hypothetical protein